MGGWASHRRQGKTTVRAARRVVDGVLGSVVRRARARVQTGSVDAHERKRGERPVSPCSYLPARATAKTQVKLRASPARVSRRVLPKRRSHALADGRPTGWTVSVVRKIPYPPTTAQSRIHFVSQSAQVGRIPASVRDFRREKKSWKKGYGALRDGGRGPRNSRRRLQRIDATRTGPDKKDDAFLALPVRVIQ